MPSKTASSYILPGIFLGVMLILFILGTWMLYERLRLGHEAAFHEAVAALPPFDPDAAAKDIAKERGFQWPLQGPLFTQDAVAKRIDRIMGEPVEDGAAKPVRKELEDKYYAEAGYVKGSTGAWTVREAVVKELLEVKRKDFDVRREQDVERLRKENSKGGFFPLDDPPKEEGK